MTRYNLFHPIHKGLRALLYDTSLLLQRTDFTSGEEADEAFSRLRFVVALFGRYQYAEEVYVLPTITAYDPGVADSFEQDHREIHELSKGLESLFHDFTCLSEPLEKVAAGNEIVVRFDGLLLFYTRHMKKEEQVAGKMLWRYHTDAELQKVAWQIISAPEPPFVAAYAKWILHGLNNTEVVHWLKVVKTTAPEQAFQEVLQTAEAELLPRRGSLLQHLLSSGVMAA